MEKLFIGWSTPWCWACILYNNKIGVSVFKRGQFPKNVDDIPTQARHKMTTDTEGVSFIGTAEIKEDYKSTLVYYQAIQQ